MNHFHALKVYSAQKETANAISIEFIIPEALKELFKFKQGQYITLKLRINGKDERRSYSIVNAPCENKNRIEILVKYVEGGIVSTYLNRELTAEKMIEVMPPMGNFYTDILGIKNYYFFAAGSGISPVLSNIKEILNTQKNSFVYLFYGNRNSENILKKKELEILQRDFSDQLKIDYFFSQEKTPNKLNEGRISESKVEEIFKRHSISNANENLFFICGPSNMITNINNYLKNEKKVSETHILFEFFVSSNINPTIEKENAEDECNVTVILDGKKHSFTMTATNESLLENILNQNLDVPFACKGGICASCKVKLLEGEVYMENSDALKSKEIKQNFILACQSFAKSKNIVVSYDI